jgi:hypothetical protein
MRRFQGLVNVLLENMWIDSPSNTWKWCSTSPTQDIDQPLQINAKKVGVWSLKLNTPGSAGRRQNVASPYMWYSLDGKEKQPMSTNKIVGSSGSRFPTHYPNIKANIFILGCHLSAGQAMPSGLSACRSVRSSSLNIVNLGQRAFRISYSANIWRESWHRGTVLSLGIQHYQ